MPSFNLSVNGINRTELSTKIYKSYDSMSTAIARINEVALSLVYDLYHYWIDNKATDNHLKRLTETIENGFGEGYMFSENSIDRVSITKTAKKKLIENAKQNMIYDKAVDDDSNPTNKSDTDFVIDEHINSFYCFVQGIVNCSRFQDIGLAIDGETYLTAISLLRNELRFNYNQPNDIFVDVCTTEEEYPFVKNVCWSKSNDSSFGIKVVPKLTNIKKVITTLDSDYSTVPEFRYVVEIDINRLILTYATIYDPSTLKEAFAAGENDKNTYIANGLSIYKNLPELITRHAILEIYNNSERIYDSWIKFINLINNTVTKISKNDTIVNIVNKLTYYRPDAASLLKFDFEKWFDDSDDNNVECYNDFMSSLYDASTYTDHTDFTRRLINTYLCKIFSTFFKTSVLVNISQYKLKEHNISKLSCVGYCREFYESYKKLELLEKTMMIDDLNVRDFIQSIIKEHALEKMFRPYNSKLKNNENTYFMWCKVNRSKWMETLLASYILINISNYISEVVSDDPSILNGVKHATNDLYRTIRRIFCYKTLSLFSNDWCENEYAGNLLEHLISIIPSVNDHISDFDVINYTDHSITYDKVRTSLTTAFDNLKKYGSIPITMDSENIVIPHND